MQRIPYLTETLFIDGPAGKLEAILRKPKEQEPTAMGLVCHPHPQQGGTMHNKVVTAINQAMESQGWLTLRFNTRGTGESEGEFDHQVGEVDDGLAAYDYLQSVNKTLPIHLGGFSFGAFIASKVASQRKAATLVTAAPVIAHSPYETIPELHTPWLIVAGADDELIDHDALQRFVDNNINPISYDCFPETSHFFHGQLITLRNRVIEFYNASLK